MNLVIKYSSEDYSSLCFRHAVQEAMRSQKIETEIGSLETLLLTLSCALCDMEESKEENALTEWFYNYVKAIENLVPKQPTEEELRKNATELRSQRKGNV